ncbi:three-Cys-motif partner protein TcmP [Sphingosinicella sp.]|uniref:three-Cys-motif partner protein TcmP n=1 Tax=Sphingosinicella sp. TaxID=1917971 RepID=UPI00403846DF
MKHIFLKQYLDSLVHKIASAFDEVVYVDGFSGPWKSSGENYTDTSFGIALKALTDAQQSWANMAHRPRNVRMTAHLVEREDEPFQELSGIGSHFPAVRVIPHHKDFLNIAPTIAAAIPSRAFSFVFVDPKGFLDLAALKPLISRNLCEVVFNLMFDYGNRFTQLPSMAPTYDRLFPGVDWNSRFAAARDDSAATPQGRKAIFLACFKEALRNIGGFEYIADVDVQYPGKDRTFYFLVYGTRRPPGIEVFRDCQLKALEAQSSIAGVKKIEAAQARGQLELLSSMNEMREDPRLAFLRSEAANAKRMMVGSIPAPPKTVQWGHLWAKVLSDHAIRKTELNKIAAELRKADVLHFPDWIPGKRVPDEEYGVARGQNWSSSF